MKSKLLFHLLVFSALLHSYQSTAQISRNYTGSSDFVTINNITLAISNLSIMDSIDAGNQKVHTASFDIKIGNNEQVRSLLTTLQSSLQGGKTLSLVFSKTNVQFAVMEQRTYSGTQVKELLLSGLAGASKEAVNASVAIQAQEVAIVYGKGEKMNSPMPGKNMLAIASNYKFELDGQAITRVTQISGLHIATSPGGTQRFYIDIPASDAQSFYDWFNTTKGGPTKKNVRITLLGSDLKAEILSLGLNDVEIISLSAESGSQETIPRVTIGLRNSGAVIK